MRHFLGLTAMIGCLVGCGQKPPTAANPPKEKGAENPPKDKAPGKPVGRPADPPADPPRRSAAVAPRKLYEMGVYATADVPADAELDDISTVIVIGDQKLTLNVAEESPAAGIQKFKKDAKTIVSEDANGILTQDGTNGSYTRYIKLGETTYCARDYYIPLAAAKELDAVAKSIRQLPDDSAAEKRAAAAAAKLPNDSSVGLHVTGIGILSRTEDKTTDAELAILKDIGRVYNLSLSNGGSITPAGLKAILGPNVRDLSLNEAWVTDSIVSALKGAKYLRRLNISSKSLTDDGVKQLAGLDQLREISLFASGVGDAGLIATAPEWKRVEKLTLASPKITAAVGPAIASMPRLETLNFYAAGVTDDIVPYLLKLPKLKEIGVRDTALTADGVKKLKAAKPDLRVRSKFDP